MMRIRWSVGFGIAMTLACHRTPRLADEGGATRDFDAVVRMSWPDYGGSASQSKYFRGGQIRKTNVAQLKQAWFYLSGDSVAYQFNPIIVDSVMYVAAKNNSL